MKKLFLFALCLLWSAPAFGRANLGIWPIEVSLWPDKKISEINLNNKGTEIVRLQIYAKHWDMDEKGKFIEADSGEFVFYPRLLTIPGGEKKTLRVGYNGEFPPLEKSYRLYIHELPELNEGGEQQTSGVKVGFNMLMRLSVPLFVSPSKDVPFIKPSIDKVTKTANGVQLSFGNSGTHHVEIKDISVELLGKGGAVLTKGNAKLKFFRVLPQRQLSMEVPLDVAQCRAASQLNVHFKTGKTEKKMDMTIPLQADCKKI
ncbi:MAG: fimbria/pilus periplasmic chaperone [Desulfobulbaceae bacterium]|nr:fimbria/pilus periplasmic chaperone [Desulfobulbaceae bacterium]